MFFRETLFQDFQSSLCHRDIVAMTFQYLAFLIRLRIANCGITDNELFAPNNIASKLSPASNNSLAHNFGMGRG